MELLSTIKEIWNSHSIAWQIFMMVFAYAIYTLMTHLIFSELSRILAKRNTSKQIVYVWTFQRTGLHSFPEIGEILVAAHDIEEAKLHVEAFRQLTHWDFIILSCGEAKNQKLRGVISYIPSTNF